MYYYKPSVKEGDIFLTYNSKFLAKGIKYIQEWHAKDGEALYSHAGIILDELGNTFESKARVCSCCFFEEYAGVRVAIYRPTKWDRTRKRRLHAAILKIINKHDGDLYPVRRLLFHAIGLAKHIHWRNQLVCSELVAKYLYYAELRHGKYYGTTPDDLHDELRNHRYFELVYEGKLPYKEI